MPRTFPFSLTMPVMPLEVPVGLSSTYRIATRSPLSHRSSLPSPALQPIKYLLLGVESSLVVGDWNSEFAAFLQGASECCVIILNLQVHPFAYELEACIA